MRSGTSPQSYLSFPIPPLRSYPTPTTAGHRASRGRRDQWDGKPLTMTDIDRPQRPVRRWLRRNASGAPQHTALIASSRIKSVKVSRNLTLDARQISRRDGGHGGRQRYGIRRDFQDIPSRSARARATMKHRSSPGKCPRRSGNIETQIFREMVFGGNREDRLFTTRGLAGGSTLIRSGIRIVTYGRRREAAQA